LASFIIVKVPPRKWDSEAVQALVNRLSAHESKAEFKDGTKPETFRSANGCIYFKAGFEYPHELEGLEDTIHVKPFKSFQIVFVEDGFLAIENTPDQTDLDWIRRFLENNFISQIVLEPIPFDERTLRKIAEGNPDVFEIELMPASPGMENVDRLKYTGRGVTRSKIHEDYGSEPIAKIKVQLDEVGQGVTVAFYKDGRLTIFRQSDPDRVTAVLKIVIDMIVAPYVKEVSYQTRLI
jgi:hypothetical protein